jgi:hypothetical protein
MQSSCMLVGGYHRGSSGGETVAHGATDPGPRSGDEGHAPDKLAGSLARGGGRMSHDVGLIPKRRPVFSLITDRTSTGFSPASWSAKSAGVASPSVWG